MTMTEALKRMLKDATEHRGMSWYQLERETGLQRGSLMRFYAGRHALRLDLADKLAGYFGIEVKTPKRKGAR